MSICSLVALQFGKNNLTIGSREKFARGLLDGTQACSGDYTEGASRRIVKHPTPAITFAISVFMNVSISK